MKIKNFQHDDWIYGVLDPNAPAESFHAFEGFVAIWQQKRVGGRLPARSDFDFEVFEGWFGWVTIDKIHYNPFDMECRLCGMHIANLQGHDETGVRLRDYENDPEEWPYYKHYLDCHEFATTHGLLTHGAGSLIHKNMPIGMEWIGLPCSNDGKIISHFISLTRQFPISELKNIKIQTLTELI